MLRVETIRNIRVKNHVADLINEFYPDNLQDFLINKQKMLFQVRDGNEEARGQFQFEDFQKLLKSINKEIENAEKNIQENGGQEEQKSEQEDDMMQKLESIKVAEQEDQVNRASIASRKPSFAIKKSTMASQKPVIESEEQIQQQKVEFLAPKVMSQSKTYEIDDEDLESDEGHIASEPSEKKVQDVAMSLDFK